MESGIFDEGDIIVIFNHDLERNRWRIGNVVKLDVIPRAAIVRINNIDNKVNYGKRPVTKLCRLEINANFDVTLAEKADVPDTFSDNEIDDDVIYERPTRIVAYTGVLDASINGCIVKLVIFRNFGKKKAKKRNNFLGGGECVIKD